MLAVHKLQQLVGELTDREIALLGLAFKPDTDDIREAPALDIAWLLHESGARLRVYDPAAMANAKPLLPQDVTFADDVYAATAGACVVVLATEWQEFVDADWAAIKEQMNEPCIILDGRNALSQDKMNGLGFRYAGVGRKPDARAKS